MFERGKKDRSEEAAGTQAAGDWNREASAPSASSGPSEMAVIGRSIRIDGDLVGEEDLRIEGDVRGTVKLRNNTLTIGSKGKVSADVYAKAITVDGQMDGDVFGSERVNIRKNAQVNGNITAPRVSLEDGAQFKGSIEMDPAAVEKATGTSARPATASPANDATAKAVPKSNSGGRADKPPVSPQGAGPKARPLS